MKHDESGNIFMGEGYAALQASFWHPEKIEAALAKMNGVDKAIHFCFSVGQVAIHLEATGNRREIYEMKIQFGDIPKDMFDVHMNNMINGGILMLNERLKT